MLQSPVLYYTSFDLYNPNQIQLLRKYKCFIENTIIKLGEDWRIEANLLTNEIITAVSEPPEFNLFNEFLATFLKPKISHEFLLLNQSAEQEEFLATVSQNFRKEEKIYDSLTFKTLSLGYCITAGDVWRRTFRTPPHQIKSFSHFLPFARLCLEKAESEATKQDSSKVKPPPYWSVLIQELSEQEIRNAKKGLLGVDRPLKDSVLLSQFVTHLNELVIGGKRVRIIGICSQFYRLAFVVWLIFSIKMFFVLSFKDYKRYFIVLVGDQWKDQLEAPLRRMQQLLQREWSRLLKDYTVALHDDIKVLEILIDKVRGDIQKSWDSKTLLLREVVIK